MIINDKNIQPDKPIVAAWKNVRGFKAMMDTHFNAPPLSPFGLITNNKFRGINYSLILIFAFSVLEDGLKVLVQKGVFSSKKINISGLMAASKELIPWRSYETINDIRILRNEIAHERRLISSDECTDYLDSIENELVGWGCLDYKYKGTYTISVGLSKKEE